LKVAGSVNRAFEGVDAPSVRFLGLVPELTLLYRDAAVVISPLTFGSGLKIKLVEALAAGKAIVATPTTLQGVTEFCAEAVVCTEDPAAFAAAVADLASSREAREALATKALACAERNFSAAKVHGDLRAWLTAMRGDGSGYLDIADSRATC
jgi:succinoglycan biosynthesis protein ExoO